MKVSKPQDLPELRMWLLDQWRPSRPFARYAAATFMPNLMFDSFSHLEPTFDTKALAEAALWWVPRDMARLVDSASRNLPPTTLTDDLMIDKCGLVVFEEPLLGQDSRDAERAIPVKAMLWRENELHHLNDNERHLSIGTYCEGVSGTANLASALIDMGLDKWHPLGRTDWRFGSDSDVAVDERMTDHERMLASMSEDRRWLATLMLLAGQPLAESSTVKITNKSKLRKLKGNVRDVRVVGLRRRPRSEPTGEHREVNWSHRWVVGEDSGGFWRQQAYGPGNSLRKPKYILPYIKGPEDKPLKVKETVKVLRGE